MSTSNWIAIAAPSVILIFYAGRQQQLLKFLTKGFRDHEKRLRDGGL